MFNFSRKKCGCNKCRQNDFYERKHDCRPEKPVCKPVCFNVTISKCHKCKEVDCCNSYPEVYHNKCDEEIEMICCCH